MNGFLQFIAKLSKINLSKTIEQSNILTINHFDGRVGKKAIVIDSLFSQKQFLAVGQFEAINLAACFFDITAYHEL